MHVTHSVHEVRDLAAPADAVWARISEHDQTHSWILEAKVRLLTESTSGNRNGVGAVREVAFPNKALWTTIHERVTAFEAPKTFSYKIIAGMPGIRDHLGTVSVEPTGEGKSRLTWHVDFEFIGWHPMGWIAGSFTRTFGALLKEAQAELARQLEER